MAPALRMTRSIKEKLPVFFDLFFHQLYSITCLALKDLSRFERSSSASIERVRLKGFSVTVNKLQSKYGRLPSPNNPAPFRLSLSTV